MRGRLSRQRDASSICVARASERRPLAPERTITDHPAPWTRPDAVPAGARRRHPTRGVNQGAVRGEAPADHELKRSIAPMSSSRWTRMTTVASRVPRITAVATATPCRRFTQAELLDLAGYRDSRRRAFFEHGDIETRALHLGPGRILALARSVLRRYMSSATVIFVLEEVLRSHAPLPGDWGVMIALGPGPTS